MIALVVLFVPYEKNHYDDGGSIEYVALAYRLVKWKFHIFVIDEESEREYHELYKETKMYFFPQNLKSFDEISRSEKEAAYKDFFERYKAGEIE